MLNFLNGSLITSVFLSVLPERPVIFDSRYEEQVKLIEPFNEGSEVNLVCDVNGGKEQTQSTL